MKKYISLLLALVMCLPIVACGDKEDKNAEALELCESAFINIQTAYKKLDAIGNDILSAWQVGINNKSEIEEWSRGFNFLCKNVSISRSDMLDGLAYYEYTSENREHSSLDYDYFKESVRKYYDVYFDGLLSRYGNTFSACIFLVVESYRQNGLLGEIESALSLASDSIKELSQNYSDYEHYENVKKYFTTANTYFNFCSNPSGTLEQARENINNYNNTADECYNSLYYFFEE